MSENKQKHTWLWDILVIVGGLLGVSGLLLVLRKIGMVALGLLFAGLLAASESYDLLLTSTSPSGEYVLEALRENTPAIEPYYVKVNLMEDGGKQTIYYVRGQSEAEIIWLSDTVAQINGVPVDVTSGECFKANARGYFSVNVVVQSEDVCQVRMNVLMGREERKTEVGKAVHGGPLDVDKHIRAELYILQDLHWDDDFDKKQAGLTVTVESADGQTFALPYLWEWTAQVYGSYDFILTGSAEEGYTLTPDGVKCTVTQRADAHE